MPADGKGHRRAVSRDPQTWPIDAGASPKEVREPVQEALLAIEDVSPAECHQQ